MNEKLRRRILFEAARLMHTRQESEYYRARIRAARKISRGWVASADLPDQREIHDVLQQLQCGGWPADQRLDSEATPVSEDERFAAFHSLLAPLQYVQQNKRSHPEGDVLYHSLQVFELAAAELPYDEEFLLAALLHDSGRGIDPLNHISAGLNALSGLISERTAWLIEHHQVARGLLDGSIGVRARRRLNASEYYEEIELLARCDRDGRVPGAQVRDLEVALEEIRGLESAFE